MSSEEVVSQLEAVRQSGVCNMLNRACVKEAAEDIGFDELVEFMTNASNEQYMETLQQIG